MIRPTDPEPRGPKADPPRADGSKCPIPTPQHPDNRCVLCGAEMYGVHCKRICPNCGYREDCTDLFPV